MAAHVVMERRLRRNVRRPRLIADRSNPLEDLPEEEVFRRYRFLPETIIYIMGLLPDLRRPTRRNQPLPPLMQLLICLRYLGTGCMHLIIGDSINVSRSTAGVCIRQISLLISRLAPQFLSFPRGDTARQTKSEFSAVAGFPNVIGCVDGTFIRIIKPNENEADFVCRKGYHAINVQMCCDAKHRITSVNASWPGSVHDSRMFRSSILCQKCENGDYNGFLLGDSGYPCRRFLMTPLMNPITAAEERYNMSLCRTRVIIEQTFGILKRRFQVLHREMLTTPHRAVVNTVACVVLHDIGIARGDICVSELPVIGPDPDPEPVDQQHAAEDGGNVRRHLIQSFFM